MTDPLREGAEIVARRLVESGYRAYFAGGCVRDMCLGVEPKDYDIVTDARPEEVMKIFKRTVKVGAAFGVVRVLLSKHREYEVATFRTETGYSDGRRPDAIEYSDSPEEDVRRRDFTINGLLMEPDTKKILDFVQGQADLDAGIVRAVGDPEARFAEDRLRMLRAVRFAARLGFEIEPETAKAVRLHAPELSRSAVSAERIVTELHLLWKTKRPAQGMRLLHDTGLFASILTDLPAEAADPVLSRFSRYEAARQGEEIPEEESLSVCWALIVTDYVDRERTEDVLRAYKLKRSVIRMTQWLVDMSSTLRSPDAHREGQRIGIVRDPRFSAAKLFLSSLDEPSAAAQHWVELERRVADNPVPPELLLTGQDLLDLGLSPGPQFKELLEKSAWEVYEGRITDRDALVAWVKAATAQ